MQSNVKGEDIMKKFMAPEMDVQKFMAEDVITTSTEFVPTPNELSEEEV